MTDSRVKDLVLRLHDIGAVKFGSFTLKSGLVSPVYFDLRVTVSYPDVLELLSTLMCELVQDIEFDLLCGVPYTALPFATCMSLKNRKPMLMVRKEVKQYGTKRQVEGEFESGKHSCLLVEDVVTSGGSVLGVHAVLQKEGLECKAAVVLLDRQQGARALMEEKGLKLFSVLNISTLLDILSDRLGPKKIAEIKEFIEKAQISAPQTPSTSALTMSFQNRSLVCENKVAADLCRLMEKKQSNLCVAVDCTSSSDVLRLAKTVGPFVCVLKTHVDIITDFSEEFVAALQKLAEEHEFMIFEDRKFADIGNTVKHQYEDGVYHIANWAHITNAHVVPGPGIIKGLRQGAGDRTRGLLLLAEMSSQGALAKGDYTKAAVDMAIENKDFVMGFISQSAVAPKSEPGLIHFTPGVKLHSKGDDLGQQYNTPSKVVMSGADVVIVGRGVCLADDPAAEAKRYMDASWNAYKQRIASNQ